MVAGSGLTCNDQNFVTKAGAQRAASELGLAIVAPDTSPRGADVPGASDNAWDFGLGAGFLCECHKPLYDRHYHMADYVQQELPGLLAGQFNLDLSRQSIMGIRWAGMGHWCWPSSIRNSIGRFLRLRRFVHPPIVHGAKALGAIWVTIRLCGGKMMPLL